MAETSKKPTKFERVYRADLKNGADYYLRSNHKHKSCSNTKKK